EIESLMQAAGQAIVDKEKNTSLVSSPLTRNDGSLISPSVEGALIDVDPTRGKGLGRITNLHERGDDHLAKFLIVQQLFGEEEVNAALESVRVANKDLNGQAMAVSMLEELCKDTPAQLDAILSALITRPNFAYVPLEYYDTDRQIAPMLPEVRTVGRL